MSFQNLLGSSQPSKSGVNSQNTFGVIDTLYDYVEFIKGGPIATLPQEKVGTEVAVIGAGVAGLVAAYELLKIGAKPIIFEASDRLGGRAYSKHFTDPDGTKSSVFAELGSMRFPQAGKLFFYYFKDVFGFTEGSNFPNPGEVYTKLYYENQTIEWKPNPSPDNEDFKQIKKDFDSFTGTLVEPLKKAWQALKEAKVKQKEHPANYERKLEELRLIWQGYIYRYQNVSFYEAIRQGIPQWNDEFANKFGALGIGSGGFGPLYPINFLEFLRILANGWEGEQKFLPFGITAFIEKFYTEPVDTPLVSNGRKSLKDLDSIWFNTQITAIEYNNARPVIHYRNPKTGEESKSFDAVIVTATNRAMELMGLTLSPSQKAEAVLPQQSVQVAIRNLHLTTASKLFIRTRTKFWLDDRGQPRENIPQTIQTDELPRGVYALDYPPEINPDNNGVVVVSYTWEDDSTKLMGLTPGQRLELFKKSIAKVSPEFADNLVPLQYKDKDGQMKDDILCIDWQSEDGYYGAFKLQYPGQEPNLQAAYYQFLSVLNPEIDRGVYLAGESVSWAGGWTEGAMHTAINAAVAAAQRIKGNVRENSPLTQDRDFYYYGQRLLELQKAVGYPRLGESENELYNEFDDTKAAADCTVPFLDKIIVRHGDIIDRLEANYGVRYDEKTEGCDRNAKKAKDDCPPHIAMFAHGGNGGQESKFEIEPGEALIEVSGYWGTWYNQTAILQLTFKTNRNKCETFGTTNNASFKQAFCFTADPEKKERIFAFHGTTFSGTLNNGRATSFLGSLGVTIERADDSLTKKLDE